MLQQTRVAAVIPYYTAFVERFPDAEALAGASEPELLARWSGLGYYSRARNLQKAARQIVRQRGFPRTHEGIRALAGAGDYTAAAVASIAFGLPHAAVDGNVLRVLARLADEPGDIGAADTRRRLHGIAAELLDRADPGRHNQAMMELGATVCLPRKPQCVICPVRELCAARRQGSQDQRPVKRRRADTVRLDKTLLWVERRGRLLLRQRPPGEAKLAGFWELPEKDEIPEAETALPLGTFRHSITNHNYRVTVVPAVVRRAPRGWRWVDRDDRASLPLSTMTTQALALRTSVSS